MPEDVDAELWAQAQQIVRRQERAERESQREGDGDLPAAGGEDAAGGGSAAGVARRKKKRRAGQQGAAVDAQSGDGVAVASGGETRKRSAVGAPPQHERKPALGMGRDDSGNLPQWLEGRRDKAQRRYAKLRLRHEALYAAAPAAGVGADAGAP